jgi:endonuclease/exonuclease/phosphatase family metal-dependent hydrolase
MFLTGRFLLLERIISLMPLCPEVHFFHPVAHRAAGILLTSRRYKCPLVVCGDFNSLRDSGVFEFLRQGSLSHEHTDLEHTNYGAFVQQMLTHKFNLASAYDGMLLV